MNVSRRHWIGGISASALTGLAATATGQGEICMALAVGLEQTPHNAEPCSLDVDVLAWASLGPRADDSVDVEVVRVEQESYERLFVIGIAARIGFDDNTKPVGGFD